MNWRVEICRKHAQLSKAPRQAWVVGLVREKENKTQINKTTKSHKNKSNYKL